MSKSSTITEEPLHNPHAGEILLEEFLVPMEISQTRLASDIDVPVSRIADIVHGKRAITADTGSACRSRRRAFSPRRGRWDCR